MGLPATSQAEREALQPMQEGEAGSDGGLAGWRKDAHCLDADSSVFFPGRGESLLPAKRICSPCPVALDCLQFAIETGSSEGVWGGMSTTERRAIARVWRSKE